MEKKWLGSFSPAIVLLLTTANVFLGAQASAVQPMNDDPAVANASGPSATTGDAALEEQITKISREMEKLNLQMARLKKTLPGTMDEAQKVTATSELEHLRDERRTLQQLLDKLVEAGKADEGTVIDQALRRARKLERIQERASEQQETIYDRRTK